MAPLIMVIVGMALLVAVVPYVLVQLYDRGAAAWTERRRLHSLLRVGGERDLTPGLSERMEIMWARFGLPGTPIEWIIGAVGLVVVGATVAQWLFGNWVLDIGLPVDVGFFVYYLVARVRRVSHDRLIGQMATAQHMVASEYNVNHNVTSALRQAYGRLPSPVNRLFAPTIKALNSGVAPVRALERLGKDLGPPYGKLFAQTLQQALESQAIERVLVQIATMTEEWVVAGKQARAVVVMPQMIAMLINAIFWIGVVAGHLVIGDNVIANAAAYASAHPYVYMPGVISVAFGFVLATTS